MKLAFKTLTKACLAESLPQLIALSADVSPWRDREFMVEQNEKWRHSFCAVGAMPVGYAIISRRGPKWLHLHQFMVGAEWRGQGVGGAMMQEVKSRCLTVDASLTLKVSVAGKPAQRFYERHGLTFGKIERDYIWMHWTLT